MKNDIGPEKFLNVIDTSAFITYPRLINHVEGQVFVPLTVIKQLDGLKNNPDIKLSTQARHASFFIERAIQEKKVALLTQFDRIDALDSESDNRIVGAAVRLKNSNPDARVALIATDRNMRIVAEGYGIVGMDMIVESGRTREDVLAEYRARLKYIIGAMVMLLGMGIFFHAFIVEDSIVRYFELFLSACILIPACVAAHKYYKRHPSMGYDLNTYHHKSDPHLENMLVGRFNDPFRWFNF